MYDGFALSRNASASAELEHAKGDEGIEEVPCAALVNPDSLSQLVSRERSLGQLGEDPQFDRAQQRLG